MPSLSPDQLDVVNWVFPSKAALVATAGAGKTTVLVARAGRVYLEAGHTRFVVFTRAARTALTDKLGAAHLPADVVSTTSLFYGTYRDVETRRVGGRVTPAPFAASVEAVRRALAATGDDRRAVRSAVAIAAAVREDQDAGVSEDVLARYVATLRAARYYDATVVRWTLTHEAAFLDEAAHRLAQAPIVEGDEVLVPTEVVMDEAQDAAALEIALLQRAHGLTGVRVLVVGDPQQAVLGFRGACGDMVAALAISDVMRLDTTYRLRREHAEGVGRLCAAIGFDPPRAVLTGGHPPVSVVTPSAEATRVDLLVLAALYLGLPPRGDLERASPGLLDFAADLMARPAEERRSLVIACPTNDDVQRLHADLTAWRDMTGSTATWQVLLADRGGEGFVRWMWTVLADPGGRLLGLRPPYNPAHAVVDVARQLRSPLFGLSAKTEALIDAQLATLVAARPATLGVACSDLSRAMDAACRSHRAAVGLTDYTHRLGEVTQRWVAAHAATDGTALLEVAATLRDPTASPPSALVEHALRHRSAGLAALVASLRTPPIAPPDDPVLEAAEGLTLAGAMQTKGLEWDVVAIGSSAANSLPHRAAASDPVAEADTHAARCLVFTLVTRARYQLAWVVTRGADYYAQRHCGH